MEKMSLEGSFSVVASGSMIRKGRRPNGQLGRCLREKKVKE